MCVCVCVCVFDNIAIVTLTMYILCIYSCSEISSLSAILFLYRLALLLSYVALTRKTEVGFRVEVWRFYLYSLSRAYYNNMYASKGLV